MILEILNIYFDNIRLHENVASVIRALPIVEYDALMDVEGQL